MQLPVYCFYTTLPHTTYTYSNKISHCSSTHSTTCPKPGHSLPPRESKPKHSSVSLPPMPPTKNLYSPLPPSRWKEGAQVLAQRQGSWRLPGLQPFDSGTTCLATVIIPPRSLSPSFLLAKCLSASYIYIPLYSNPLIISANHSSQALSFPESIPNKYELHHPSQALSFLESIPITVITTGQALSLLLESISTIVAIIMQVRPYMCTSQLCHCGSPIWAGLSALPYSSRKLPGGHVLHEMLKAWKQVSTISRYLSNRGSAPKHNKFVTRLDYNMSTITTYYNICRDLTLSCLLSWFPSIFVCTWLINQEWSPGDRKWRCSLLPLTAVLICMSL